MTSSIISAKEKMEIVNQAHSLGTISGTARQFLGTLFTVNPAQIQNEFLLSRSFNWRYVEILMPVLFTWIDQEGHISLNAVYNEIVEQKESEISVLTRNVTAKAL